METQDIENRFTLFETNVTQKARIEGVRQYAKQLAEVINEICPDSREKSLAMTKLEEVVMWANASIARNE